MPSLPVLPESCTHVLAEFDCLDPLLNALRLDSGRIKCTCVGVSKKWLALGTSAGGLQLIQREGWKQRLILTHKEGFITQVACCPHDEDFIAVATSQGMVVVWELHVERRGRPEHACVSWEHRGNAITALCWDTAGLRVFAGDAGGKVSSLRAGSSKLGKGSAFVIFPIQTITTVDSKVVQLGYQDGRLVVSSLSRCYLCDTEREKFWRVGNKERDGEYGACFFPQARGPSAGGAPLLYCARPGSRVWEVNFSGEVLSTHQFKQLLACPAVPLISYRGDPQFSPAQRSPQTIAFRRLLYLSEQNLLTWTDSAIYIFAPQCGQVLLWTEIKDVVEVAIYRNELFCLHGDGHLSHLTLLSAERCVERLIRRERWPLAAMVCCMFQLTIAPCRARKSLPIDRVEYLRSQLDPATQQELMSQLEDVLPRLEPLDSACSSRRSSISSHESFNVLDCGIYRVISRRGSQSDEETSSLVSQLMLEEERLKEFSFVQEEEPVEQAPPITSSIISESSSSERTEPERPESGLQFHLPLSFRPKPPLVALQAVRDSVSSFVKKTSEKINTLQMNSDLWPRADQRETGQCEVTAEVTLFPDDLDSEIDSSRSSVEIDLKELRAATQKATARIQDPLVLLDSNALGEVLQEWLPALERVLGPEGTGPAGDGLSGRQQHDEKCSAREPLETDLEPVGEEDKDSEADLAQVDGEGQPGADPRPGPTGLESTHPSVSPPELVCVESPCPIPSDLQTDLSQLASLCLDLGCYHGSIDHESSEEDKLVGPCIFLRRYFFLLEPERTRRCCLQRYQGWPALWTSYMAGLLELTRSDPVVEVMEKGDLLRSLKSLREQQPWAASSLLAHLHRLYVKHGESAVRSFVQFYPKIVPADIMAMVDRSHFLAYLDNLVLSQAEGHRLSFLGSLLQPESLRQDWLELALSHDAPRQADTLTADGQPRWRSHLFTWGYARLISLLIRLPADFESKQKMAETCRTHGYWLGYLSLCCELHHRSQAFSTICLLDDMSLLQEPGGIMPETLDEWKLLIQLSQNRCDSSEPDADLPRPRGNGLSNGSYEWNSRVTPESLTLQLARVVGPDRALDALRSWGVHVDLSPRATMVCELLRIAEKRQRALIRTMLERCDRFLWSQQA